MHRRRGSILGNLAHAYPDAGGTLAVSTESGIQVVGVIQITDLPPEGLPAPPRIRYSRKGIEGTRSRRVPLANVFTSSGR